MNVMAAGCDSSTPDIVIHDDNEAENGYGWNANAGPDARMADKFTPAAYPATIETVCVSFITNSGVTQFDFSVAVYADDGTDGAPGTLLGSKDFVGHPESIAGLPFIPTFENFDISDLAIPIDSGSVYISVNWNAATAPSGVYVASDESPSTPLAGGYNYASDGVWNPLGGAENQPGYRALMIRATMPTTQPGPPSLQKAFSPAQMLGGDTSTLTITLRNTSQPTDAVLAADLVDNLPTGMEIAATPNASTTCTNGNVVATAGGSSVTLEAGAAIPAEDSCTVTVDVTAQDDGDYVNTIAAGALDTQHGSNAGDASATLLVGFTFPEPYCDANFPLDVEPISRVIVGNIDNPSDPTVNGSPALEDFLTVVGDLSQGASYPIAVEGNTNGSYTTKVRVYIDWNQNGDFSDPGEVYDLSDLVGSTGVDGKQATGSIAVPEDALLGETRMRVTKRWNEPAAPCNNAGYGQAEDYTIVVNDNPPPVPAIELNPEAFSLSFAADEGDSDSDEITISNIGDPMSVLDYRLREALAASQPNVPSSRFTSNLSKRTTADHKRQALLGIKHSLNRSDASFTSGVSAPFAILAEHEIAQMSDHTPESGNSISCGNQDTGTTSENSWWRRFYFDEHTEIDGPDVAITSVMVATEDGPNIPATVNVYTIPKSVTPETIPLSQLTLVGTGTGTVGGTATYSDIEISPPAMIANIDDVDLVVEYHIAGSSSGFFPGGNSTPQTHSSFIYAPGCGLAEPETTGSIGYPDFHIIMVVTVDDDYEDNSEPGCDNPTNIPWLSAAPAIGSVNAGDSTDVTVTADASNLTAGSYDAMLCVESNDPTFPRFDLDVSFEVAPPPPPAPEIFMDGFEGDDPPEDPDVITGMIDLPLIQSEDGSTFDFLTGQWDTYNPARVDDINLYDFGEGMYVYWYGDATALNVGGVVDANDEFAVLQSGDTVGPSSPILPSSIPMANWTNGADGYIGIAFENEDTGELNYGYIRLITSGPDGYPGQALEYGYNRKGDAITIP